MTQTPELLPVEQSDREALVTELARAALLHAEHARTDVVNPVNGSAPYSFVLFHGQRIEFHDNPCANSFERDAGSGKAAAYAQKINDGLFELAKAATRKALSHAIHEPASVMREEAAKVAETWKSSLRPGTEARLLGHQEAARAIAAAIRNLPLSDGVG